MAALVLAVTKTLFSQQIPRDSLFSQSEHVCVCALATTKLWMVGLSFLPLTFF